MMATVAYIVVAATVIFLALPIVSLIVMSFSAAEYVTFPPIGFSLKWYGRILQMPTLRGRWSARRGPGSRGVHPHDW